MSWPWLHCSLVVVSSWCDTNRWGHPDLIGRSQDEFSMQWWQCDLTVNLTVRHSGESTVSMGLAHPFTGKEPACFHEVNKFTIKFNSCKIEAGTVRMRRAICFLSLYFPGEWTCLGKKRSFKVSGRHVFKQGVRPGDRMSLTLTVTWHKLRTQSPISSSNASSTAL